MDIENTITIPEDRAYITVADKLHQSIISQATQGYIYQTQPHSSPLVHTLHSEWIDSPSNSPSKMLYTKVYETPSKSKALNFLTPVSETRDKSFQQIQMEVEEDVKAAVDEAAAAAVAAAAGITTPSPTPSPSTLPSKKKITFIDIFWSMLNDVVGKDKLAKFGQYALRLLLHWASKSENYLSDNQLNYKIIDGRYNDRSKKLSLFMNFLKHPQNFVKIVAILVCAVFQQRFSGMVKGLSLYRQFLRFGKTPFRLRNLFNKFQNCITIKNGGDFLDLQKFNANFVNRATLGDLAGLYYGMNDEALLLYKLDLLKNKSLHKVVARHESLAWYYDTMLGLYNAYEKLQNLQLKEMELKIQIQVKSRSRIISRQLLGGSTNSFDPTNADDRDSVKLKEIQFKKTNAYLDIYKGLSDFIFNSYTVFRTPLPFATLQIWMGISASSLSIVKLYRETKQKLEA